MGGGVVGDGHPEQGCGAWREDASTTRARAGSVVRHTAVRHRERAGVGDAAPGARGRVVQDHDIAQVESAGVEDATTIG